MFIRLQRMFFYKSPPSSVGEPLLQDDGYHSVDVSMLAKSNDPAAPLIESDLSPEQASTSIADIFETPEGHAGDDENSAKLSFQIAGPLMVCYSYVNTLFHSITSSLSQAGSGQQANPAPPQNTDPSVPNDPADRYSQGYTIRKR